MVSWNSRDQSDLKAHLEHLAQLLRIAGIQLDTMAKGDQKVTFKAWSAQVREAASNQRISLTNGQLEWLWDALTTEPGICQKLGTRILSREDEWKARPTVIVLNSGHILGVFLKGLTAFGAPVLSMPGNTQPDAMITLLGPLTMAPRKAGRFECRDVKARVEIPVDKAGSLDQEAVLMKLERIDLTVQRNMVMAWVRSLNHALTVTSRRLQPHRRGHGGRIYDHIAWRKDNHWISLEDVRRAVEAGKWKVE
jgi:hypothetical protein